MRLRAAMRWLALALLVSCAPLAPPEPFPLPQTAFQTSDYTVWQHDLRNVARRLVRQCVAPVRSDGPDNHASNFAVWVDVDAGNHIADLGRFAADGTPVPDRCAGEEIRRRPASILVPLPEYAVGQSMPRRIVLHFTPGHDPPTP